jgi:hypothetical protein
VRRIFINKWHYGRRIRLSGHVAPNEERKYAYIVLKGHFVDADVTGKVYEKGSKK